MCRLFLLLCNRLYTWERTQLNAELRAFAKLHIPWTQGKVSFPWMSNSSQPPAPRHNQNIHVLPLRDLILTITDVILLFVTGTAVCLSLTVSHITFGYISFKITSLWSMCWDGWAISSILFCLVSNYPLCFVLRSWLKRNNNNYILPRRGHSKWGRVWNHQNEEQIKGTWMSSQGLSSVTKK